MKNEVSKAPSVRFLPLKNFHIAPVWDVSPEALKLSAKKCLLDREKVKLTTRQNAIVKSLGFKGGMAGFREDFLRDLRPFMVANDLLTPADLITPQFDRPIISLSPRQLADRLYRSGKQLAQRVFTGYNIDWGGINDRYFGLSNPWCQTRGLGFQDVVKALSGGLYPSLEGLSASEMLASALEAKRSQIYVYSNLLGNQLLKNDGEDWAVNEAVPQLYFPEALTKEEIDNEVAIHAEAIKIFRLWAESSIDGWVEVIPFNVNLIFLKGVEGQYDFLFPGLRNESFNHNQYEPYLKNSDVSKSNDEYHFLRWLYFEYTGWYESDLHKAEMAFYEGGGSLIDYPGQKEVFRDYMTNRGDYHFSFESAPVKEGFCPQVINVTKLCVSDLITVDEFRNFMQFNPEYARYRAKNRTDDWESVNLERDGQLPAAVTWYDANAYAAWIKKTRKIPVRLLTEEEYLTIASPVMPDTCGLSEEDFFRTDPQNFYQFYEPDGTPITDLSPYMIDDKFHTLLFGFIAEQVKWAKDPSGLKFLVSHHFGEWLMPEGAAVNCATLTTLCYPEVTPSRGRFSAQSTGRYKFKKVGFRLCYLGE